MLPDRQGPRVQVQDGRLRNALAEPSVRPRGRDGGVASRHGLRAAHVLPRSAGGGSLGPKEVAGCVGWSQCRLLEEQTPL